MQCLLHENRRSIWKIEVKKPALIRRFHYIKSIFQLSLSGWREVYQKFYIALGHMLVMSRGMRKFWQKFKMTFNKPPIIIITWDLDERTFFWISSEITSDKWGWSIGNLDRSLQFMKIKTNFIGTLSFYFLHSFLEIFFKYFSNQSWVIRCT